MRGAVTLLDHDEILARTVASQNTVEEGLGNAGEETRRFRSHGELFAIERGAQQMTLEHEVLADRTEAQE